MGNKAGKANSRVSIASEAVQANHLVTEAAEFATGILDEDDLSSQLELLISCRSLVNTADYCVVVLERDSGE